MHRAMRFIALLLTLMPLPSLGISSAAAQATDTPPVTSACPTPASRTEIIFPPPDRFVAPADLPMRLAEAQQRWQDSGITSYCINVEYIAFISYAGPRVLEVRNGNIVAQPPPCMGGSNRCLSSTERAEDYTVPGLFAFLQGELSDPGRQVNLVAFDAMYGYPIWITTDTRSNATDMGRMRVVTSFMPLP